MYDCVCVDVRFGKETRMLLPPQGWICTHHHRPIGHAAWNKKKGELSKHSHRPGPATKSGALWVFSGATPTMVVSRSVSIITTGARQAPLWWRVGWAAEDGSTSNNIHLHLVAVEMTIHFPTAWRSLAVLWIAAITVLWEDDPVPSPRAHSLTSIYVA